MKKFYCNMCEKEVELIDGKCPICKTNWNKIISENTESTSMELINDKQYNDDFSSKPRIITEEEIQNNINFFLSWAKISKIFMIIVAIIVGIIAIVCADDTEGISLLLLVVTAMIIFSAFIFENNLKWKSYMLYTNSKNKKNK